MKIIKDKEYNFERYVSIGIQDNTYDYNDECWDSIQFIIIIRYFKLMYKLIILYFYWNYQIHNKIQ